MMRPLAKVFFSHRHLYLAQVQVFHGFSPIFSRDPCEFVQSVAKDVEAG